MGEKEKKVAVEKKEEGPSKQEIVLRVFMHCEGCATKVRRCLKGFEGVESVTADRRTSEVVVKGEKADPLKVLERVQRKSHRKVELISPIHQHKPPETENETEKEKEPEKDKEPDDDDKKLEQPPAVITVVLGVYMHCDACAQEIKRRIQRMEGVESAEADVKSLEVNVKGVFEPQKLIDYVYKRTGKHAVTIKVEAETDKAKEVEEEKKDKEEENKEGGGDTVDATSSSGGGGVGGEPEAEVEDPKLLELRKIEFHHNYPHNYYQMYPLQEMNAYPPQIFSDENSNACSIM